MQQAKKILFMSDDSKVKPVPLKLAHNKSYLDTKTYMEEVKTEIRLEFNVLAGNEISNSHWPNIFGTTSNPWLTCEFSNSGIAGNNRIYCNIGSSVYLNLVDPLSWSIDEIYEIDLTIDPTTHSWTSTGTFNANGTYLGNIAN